MSGLRETQKAQRKEAILVAAMQHFESNGYSATTVEQIAADSGVSAPTVFNYFGSKQEILFALVDRANRCAIVETQIQIPTFTNAVDALCNLQATVMKRELEALPITIWRELVNVRFNSPLSEGMLLLDQRLASEIAALLRELQRRGMLNSNIDADFTASFLNDYAALLFARLVRQDAPDFAGHVAQVRRAAKLVFSGLRP